MTCCARSSPASTPTRQEKRAAHVPRLLMSTAAPVIALTAMAEHRPSRSWSPRRATCRTRASRRSAAACSTRLLCALLPRPTRRSPPGGCCAGIRSSFERQMPSAFIAGQPHGLVVTLIHEGPRPWHVDLFDHLPATMAQRLLPATVVLPAARRASSTCATRSRLAQRGEVVFEAAAIRVRSRLGLVDLQLRVGAAQDVQVFPNFAALSRYAWLAGVRRTRRDRHQDLRRARQRHRLQAARRIRARHVDAPPRLEGHAAPSPRGRARVPGRPRPVGDVPARCGRRTRASERSSTDGSHFDSRPSTPRCCWPTSR